MFRFILGFLLLQSVEFVQAESCHQIAKPLFNPYIEVDKSTGRTRFRINNRDGYLDSILNALASNLTLLPTQVHKLREPMKRLIENLENTRGDRHYFQLLTESFGYQYEVKRQPQKPIPPKGVPLVVYGNHALHGIDGLVTLDYISRYRDDVMGVMISALQDFPGMDLHAFFINPGRSRYARIETSHSLSRIKEHVKNGGAIVIFPAGAVSYRQGEFPVTLDGPWKPGILKIASVRPDVVLQPFFVEGESSDNFITWRRRLGSAASSLNVREMILLQDQTVRVHFGTSRTSSSLEGLPLEQRLGFLRSEVYGLRPRTDIPGAN